jgi:O-acetylserine/cysteine efflux transporter
MMALAPRHLALLIGITLVWGFNLIVAKVGIDSLPPILFTALRFALLALVLTPFLKWRPDLAGALIVVALLLGAVHFGLMFAGLARSASVSTVAIVGQLGVPFTTLLSIVLLGEEVRWRRWTGIGLAFAGACLMGFDPAVFDHLSGTALVVASAFLGSLGLIAVKRLPRLPPLELQAWIAWVSWPLLLALSLATEPVSVDTLRSAGWGGWAGVLYTAIAASLFGHTAYFWLLQRYPVTRIAPMTVLSPVFSVLFGVWLLGDQLTPRVVFGGLLTLAGVFVITLREPQPSDTGS